MTISYYVRQVTLEDIKFAQEGTDVYNSAYTTHGAYIDISNSIHQF